MEGISDAKILDFSKILAWHYPYSVDRIFAEGKKIANKNGYELMCELKKPLEQRITQMMMMGIN